MKNRVISLVLTLALVGLNCISVIAVDTQIPVGSEKLSNAVVLFVGSSNTLVKNKLAKVDSTNEEVKPFIVNNRTLVPLRFISESFNADVKYDDATKSVTVTMGSTIIELTIGENVIYVNGEAQQLDVPAQTVNDRTFIPLRSMVNAIGKKVFWDEKGMIVISETENILDSTSDKDLIDSVITKIKSNNDKGQTTPKTNDISKGVEKSGMPGFMGNVVSVNGNTITVQAGGPQGQNENAQATSSAVTITVPDGITIKKETKPNDTNPTEIKISNIKAGMLLLVWYTDDSKTTISDIRVADAMGVGGMAPNSSAGAGNVGEMQSADLSVVKNKWLDVPYATQSDSQKLDILLPNTGNGPFPVIVAIHGGAFIMGNKKMCESGATLSAIQNGYALVSVDYRLSGEAKFPAAIYDVKAAIRFIRANASKYSLNADKIAVWGGSAGGSLAALVGTSGGVAELEDLTMGNAPYSSKVQAVVDWYGPIYFSTMDAEFAALNQTPAMGATSTSSSPETKYIGYTIGTTEAEPYVAKASPQTYIDANDPPFFIQHGTADRNIPITQSINFSNKLISVLGSSKVTYIPITGAGHGGSQFESTVNANLVFAFLDKYLK